MNSHTVPIFCNLALLLETLQPVFSYALTYKQTFPLKTNAPNLVIEIKRVLHNLEHTHTLTQKVVFVFNYS